MRTNLIATGARVALGMWVAASLWAAPFSFTTGTPDGRLGAAARRASPGILETETADDFNLQETTVINQATITGLVPLGTLLANIKEVEVEVYHVFPLDSAPASGKVPSRVNSPSDVEIGTATRSGGSGTLTFSASVLNASFSVGNTVVNNINLPAVAPGGEGPSTGEEVEITIVFRTPIILPAGHYFFRPEVLLTDGDFLYLSAPRPIVAPGDPFVGDLQAWIRNSGLAPDWLRIGTDIVGGATPPTFSMTFSLAGESILQAGVPGQEDCHDTTTSALANQFGGISGAASSLKFSSVQSLQVGFRAYCRP